MPGANRINQKGQLFFSIFSLFFRKERNRSGNIIVRLKVTICDFSIHNFLLNQNYYLLKKLFYQNLVIIFRDANTPYGVLKTDTGEIYIPDIPTIETEDKIHKKEAAMLINTLLIIIGFLDIIFSLPSVIICLR